jgi:hypothetical protein
MVIRGANLVRLLSVIAFLLVGGCSSRDSTAPKNNVPASIEKNAQRLIADLTKQGYEVTRGYFKLYTEDDCADSYETMKSCYGNNPAAPYVMFAVPPWPEEFVDPATKLAWGPTPEGYDTTFRLDPREAIVIFGRLPPKAAYLGIQTYLYTREGAYDESSGPYTFFANRFPGMLRSFFTTVPKNPKRIQPFASLSNSNNSVVIERQSGAAFDQERFLVITPDQFMDGAIREALNKISVGEANIFTEPIPSTARTGLDEQADEFVTFIRYAEPQDKGAPGTPSDAWRKDLPLVVLRVRDTRQERPPEPYGPVVLETRTAADESGLRADLMHLVAEVNSRWGQPCAKDDCSDRTANFIDLQSPPINLVGPLCTQIGMNCLGDTQDTTYQGTPNLSLDDGEIYAVVGTLGTETGNATYVGLSVNESLMLKGVENISSDQLKGTALDYAGAVNNADKFYVYYFTRDCSDLQDLTGGHCFSISESAVPPCSDPASPTCAHLKLVQREYVRQGTQRGPDSTLTLLPRLIKLKRP